VVYIFTNTEQNDISRRACGIILQGYGCSEQDPSLEWTINIESKPEVDRKTDNTRADVKVSLHIYNYKLRQRDLIFPPFSQDGQQLYQYEIKR
jgi:hypothetical protein